MTLKLRVTRSFALALSEYAAELGLSQSLLMREAIRRGLPALVNDVRFLLSKGYRPAAYLEGVVTGAAGGMRRPLPTWVSTPETEAASPDASGSVVKNLRK